MTRQLLEELLYRIDSLEDSINKTNKKIDRLVRSIKEKK